MLMVLVLASCTSNISDPIPQDKMVFSAVASHSVALQRKSIITTTNYPLDEPFVVEAVHYPNGDESAKGETFMANEPIATTSRICCGSQTAFSSGRREVS